MLIANMQMRLLYHNLMVRLRSATHAGERIRSSAFRDDDGHRQAPDPDSSISSGGRLRILHSRQTCHRQRLSFRVSDFHLSATSALSKTRGETGRWML